MQRLKALDVYGNSLIVIYGDHGGGVPFEMRTADGRVTTSIDSLRRVWGNPLPLVLIKPPLASGRVRISDQAVALTDIPATIADLLGEGGHPFPGQSMFAEPAERPRVRTFWRSLEHRNDAAAKDRFDTISRFDVTGSVYDLAAWSDEKLLQAPVLGEELTYRWGTDLTFGGQGTYKRFQEGGWSVTRAGSVTWTDGNEAGLSVPMPVASAQVRMRVMVKPFLVPGKLERQRVTVSVNGREITQWLLTESRFQSLDALIPAEALSRGEETAVRFILRDAAAPASLGTGKDRRKLALAFMSLRFDELASPESGGS